MTDSKDPKCSAHTPSMSARLRAHRRVRDSVRVRVGVRVRGRGRVRGRLGLG